MNERIPRHKVFISYYHADDQRYKDELLRQNEVSGDAIFLDWSVHEDEIDDTYLTSEQIRQIIRDDYIKDSTVLILLCGENSRYRKHIDWEIHSAMFNTQKNPQMGILVINLPTISHSCRAHGDVEKTLVSPGGSWISLSTRTEYETAYPYVPERIIDNFYTGVSDSEIISISVVDWNRIFGNPDVLKELVHVAYERCKTSKHYDHSRKLRGRNS
jgi:hypothetical protein